MVNTERKPVLFVGERGTGNLSYQLHISKTNFPGGVSPAEDGNISYFPKLKNESDYYIGEPEWSDVFL